MKNKILKRRNLIALALAAVLTVTGFSAYRVNAAKAIETTENTVTLALDKTVAEDIKAYKNDATLNAYFYKIGDIDSTGKYTSTGVVSDATFNKIDSDTTAEEMKALIAEAEEKVTAKNSTTTPVATVDVLSTGKVEKLPNALYLVMYDKAQSARYDYTFSSVVISAPQNAYSLGTSTTDDTWVNDYSIEVKYGKEQRYGSLNITKTLDTYNQSLGNASFVYEVKAVLDEKTVLDNVYSIDFTSADKKSIEVKNIPATATVTVTEVYSGASYTAKAASVSGLTISADKAVEAVFENDYNDKLDTSALAVTNQFTSKANEDGSYTFSWEKVTGQTTTNGGAQ